MRVLASEERNNMRDRAAAASIRFAYSVAVIGARVIRASSTGRQQRNADLLRVRVYLHKLIAENRAR